MKQQIFFEYIQVCEISGPEQAIDLIRPKNQGMRVNTIHFLILV